jgi:hypothetical protein
LIAGTESPPNNDFRTLYDVDYNVYYNPASDEWFDWHDATHTFSSWQTCCFDENGTNGSNPGVSPGNDYYPENLTWSNDSVLIDSKWYGNAGAVQLHTTTNEAPVASKYRGGRIRGGYLK